MKTCRGNREDLDAVAVSEAKVVRGSRGSFTVRVLTGCRVCGAARVIWLCPQCSLLSSGGLRRAKRRGERGKRG